MISETGIYTIDAADYHSDPCETPALSSSIAKILCSDSPWHAWTAHPRLNPNFTPEEKELFDLGTVAHALMLQGLEIGHIIQATKKEGRGKNRIDTGEPVTDYRSKEAQEERNEARAAGKFPILAHQWNRVKAMVESGKAQIASHKEANDAFVAGLGLAEQTLIWIDDHGVRCKARLDWLKTDRTRIYDYKSTGITADAEKLSKYATSQGWDIQSAFYLRGLKAVTGIDGDFLFVAQEDYEPYALSVIGLGEESLMVGAKKVQFAIDLFAKCMKSGEWPGYSRRISPLPFDMWDAERWAARELR